MLTGRTIAITRPRGQCEALAQAIRHHGGTPLIAPLMAIEPLEKNADLQLIANTLDAFSLVIFISPNSVEYGLPILLQDRSWPAGLQPAAIGPGTVKVLDRWGLPVCVLPVAPHFDSEGLLNCAALSPERIAGRKVLLVRGVGGRELLADTLRERGADVSMVSCYRRVAPENLLQPLQEAVLVGSLDGMIVSSSESLKNLLDALSEPDRPCFMQVPLFVPHERIAENARRAGFVVVVLTPPAEEGLLKGLLTYNWPC